jgi:hypothetical protein
MNTVSLVLFVHVVGMLGVFVALGLDGISISRLRRSSRSEELAPWVGLSAAAPPTYRASIALVVISGGYLARDMVRGVTAGAFASELGWLTTSIIALIVFAVTAVLSLRRMQPFWRAASSAPAPESVALARAHDPRLQLLFNVRAILALTIVFLMMIRPSLEASILILVGATALALVSSGFAWDRSPRANAAHEV